MKSKSWNKKKSPLKNYMVLATSFVKMKCSEDVLYSWVSLWVTWSILKLWHNVTGTCSLCHCSGWCAERFINEIPLNTAAASGWAPCRPKSLGVSPGNEQLQALWWQDFVFCIQGAEEWLKELPGSVFRCCSQTHQVMVWCWSCTSTHSQTQILILAGLLSLQGRLSSFRIWQVLSNCH